MEKDQQEMQCFEKQVQCSTTPGVSRWILWLLGLIFIISLSALGGVAWVLSEHNGLEQQWQKWQGTWVMTANTRQSQFQEIQHQLQQRLDAQSAKIMALKQQLAVVTQAHTTGAYVSALAQLDYLVRVASWQVNLLSHPHGMTLLINEALAVIDRSADSRLEPMRLALIQDRRAVASQSTFSIADLIAQLDHLISQVGDLPMLPSQSFKVAHQSGKTGAETIKKNELTDHSWRNFLNVVLRQLKTLVVVKRTDLPAPVVLSDQQSGMVRMRLRNQLTQAQWALLNGDQVLWQHRLAEVSQMAHQFFSADQNAVRAFIQSINRLHATDLPSPVTLNNSLEVLNQLENHLSVAPAHSVVNDHKQKSALEQNISSTHLSMQDQHVSQAVLGGGIT